MFTLIRDLSACARHVTLTVTALVGVYWMLIWLKFSPCLYKESIQEGISLLQNHHEASARRSGFCSGSDALYNSVMTHGAMCSVDAAQKKTAPTTSNQ